MAIKGLQIIGESINDSVPSTHKFYSENNMDGILKLARQQADKGAAYIDVNVGRRGPEFMAAVIRAVQEGTDKPLSIDSPDPELAQAGLEAYNSTEAGLPILNSISPLRTEMFELFKVYRFKPILLVSEGEENGKMRMNNSSHKIYEAAKQMLRLAAEQGIPVDWCIFDVGIAPLAIDSEGLTRQTYEAIRLIAADPAFKGCSFSLGLTNFSHMLPPKRPSDKMALRSALESALLTKLMPLGLNMVIGSVHRNYRLLESGHPALECLEDVLQLEGFDTVMRVQTFLTT